jgi:hypothetical protein
MYYKSVYYIFFLHSPIILFSLLKLLIDLSQDGFIEGCYSFLLLASTLLLFNFVAHKLKLTKNLT